MVLRQIGKGQFVSILTLLQSNELPLLNPLCHYLKFY